MTQLPSFPQSRRNLDDLDSLIDASIGKSASHRTDAPAQPSTSPTTTAPPERFRISIDPAVIVATKLAALQRKVAPSDIVELALKQYLGLDET